MKINDVRQTLAKFGYSKEQKKDFFFALSYVPSNIFSKAEKCVKSRVAFYINYSIREDDVIKELANVYVDVEKMGYAIDRVSVAVRDDESYKISAEFFVNFSTAI